MITREVRFPMEYAATVMSFYNKRCGEAGDGVEGRSGFSGVCWQLDENGSKGTLYLPERGRTAVMVYNYHSRQRGALIRNFLM